MTLTASTSALAFAATKIGQSSDHQLNLTNSSEAGSFAFRIADDTFGLFSIVSFEEGNGDVRIGNGESISLTIRFSPTHLLGGPEFTATLVVSSGGVDTGIRVALTGTVQECVLVTPASIDFGSVEVGNSAVKSFSVTNQTYADVQLELPPNSRGLSLVGPASIPSGTSPVMVLLSFAPTAVGALPPTSLTLQPGVATITPQVVSITGTGVGVGTTTTVPEASPGVAAATPSGAVDATTSNQRYVVELQRPVSYLGMGQSLSDKSATSQTLNGICLSTAEKIYISATTPNTSDIQITSQSNVIIDALGAAGTINLYGKKTAIVDSGGAAYLLGAGGVMIAAGLTDSHGPGGGYTVSTTTQADDWGKGFTATDMTIGGLLTVAGFYSTFKDRKKTARLRIAWEVAAGIVGGAGVVAGGLGYGGEVATTTVLGQYGVTVATPAYLAMYGLCGASMVSLFPAIFGLADTTVMAVDDVAVQAILGTVNITGGSEVSIRAHGPEGIEIVSKGKPKLKYTGIPNLLAPSAHRPVSIRGNEVSVQAVDSILLRVGKIQNGLVTGLNAPTVMLSSEGITSSIGDLSLELRKDEFKLTVGKQVLKIDKNGINLVGEKIAAIAGDSEMTLSKKAAILKNKGTVTADSTGAKLQMKANSVWTSGSGVLLDGKQTTWK